MSINNTNLEQRLTDDFPEIKVDVGEAGSACAAAPATDDLNLLATEDDDDVEIQAASCGSKACACAGVCAKALAFVVALPFILVGAVLFLAVALLLLPCQPRLLPHIVRDLRFLKHIVGTKKRVDGMIKASNKRFTVVDYFGQALARVPHKCFIRSGGFALTYAEMDIVSTDIALFLSSELGIGAGDTIALSMSNSPE